jgi:hypothetical protein
MIKIETVYQYSVKEDPTCESDWSNCTKEQYQDLEGYAPRRKVERTVKPNEWDDLWSEFKTTPEYKQSIAALQVRAYVDWLRDNFNAPVKK